ncbi:DUF5701 family protein [Candidatus Parcubacteria bacterium]|nr:DUF5701 family protein [Candidatus Parcubacteria bacterium]
MNNLSNDHRKNLIIKLVDCFGGLTVEDIDSAVSEAKEKLAKKVEADRKRDYASLFDSQMETIKEILASMKIPSEAILGVFQDKKSEVINRAGEMDIPEGNIPFLLVITRAYLGITGLIAMVRNRDNVGYTYINPNKITDNVEPQESLYVIYDVEPGKATLGKSPREAEAIIKKQNRLPHIPDEDIAVCIHTDVLSDHYLWSTGSRYKDADNVPYIYLYDGKPKLHWSYIDNSADKWGSASCRSRS